MRQQVILILAVIIGLGAGTFQLQAQQVTVIKTDGTQITGDLLRQDSSSLTLRLADTTIPVLIAKDEVREIRNTPTVLEQYLKRRSLLKDDDVQGRYELAKWLYDQRELVPARRELLELRELRPDEERVRLLLGAVEEQIKAAAAIAAAKRTNAKGDTTPAASAGTPASPSDATGEKATTDTRLTDEQINLIRIYEFDTKARPPLRVQVPDSVFDALFEKYRQEPTVAAILKQTNGPALFRNKAGHEVLEFLFTLKARELYNQVRVMDDPPSLKTFRTRIHQNYVRDYCGTTNCHGGTNKASRDFFLFRNNPWEDATAYTNFYILHAYQNESQRMIDRLHPEDSLLIQYGLPRRDAKHPHPDKGQWRPSPALNSAGSLRTTLIEWMNKELLPEALLPGGTYPIDYTLPHQAPRVPAASPKAPPAPPAPPATPAASPVNKPSPKPVAPAPASPKPTAP